MFRATKTQAAARFLLVATTWLGVAGFAVPADAQLTAVPASSVTRGRETDQIRGWYRDYLGREAGEELGMRAVRFESNEQAIPAIRAALP